MVTETARKTTGRAIYEYLNDHGVRQTWLARRMGWPIYELNRRLLDRKSYFFSVEDIRRIARILKVDRDLEDEWIGLLPSRAA